MLGKMVWTKEELREQSRSKMATHSQRHCRYSGKGQYKKLHHSISPLLVPSGSGKWWSKQSGLKGRVVSKEKLS